MTTIRIHGASDDLVEVEGVDAKVDGADEYGFYGRGKWGYLLASDGTMLRVAYSPDGSGCWRIKVERAGGAKFKKVRSGKEDADDKDGVRGYSDLVHLTGDFEWVRWFGTDLKAADSHLAMVAEPEFKALWASLQVLIRKGYEVDAIQAAVGLG